MARPRTVFAVVLALVGLALLAMTRIHVDTDPENMLSADQVDRLFHAEAKARFDLRDALVVGLVDEGPQGVYNPTALARLHALTRAISELDGVVARDVLSLASVDDVRPDGPGSVRFAWLMPTPPRSQAEADGVRAAVARMPMYEGSLVSEDGQAAAIFVPVTDKHQSHRVAEAIRAMVADDGGAQRYFVTGLPVAEDTFGVEMFIQMAISAPLAALVIVVMLWLFFRSGGLIASPVLLALASVILTMGALIGCGFPVHIMSSMIPIFLMPVAVVDSVHVLSEFKDRFAQTGDVESTLERVMATLYRPMLFTSLTSAAGFGSLALTPIPPVRVFGVFVALGIALAFVLTLTLLPAYVVRLDPTRLQRLLAGGQSQPAAGRGAQSRALSFLGRLSVTRRGAVLGSAFLLALVSLVGIGRIRVNDNPVRWFAADHALRVADRVLNRHFAGTYRTYLVLDAIPAADWDTALEAQAKPLLVDASPAVRAVFARELAASDSPGALARKLIASQDGADDADYERYGALIALVERIEVAGRVLEQPPVLAAIDRLQSDLVARGLVGKATSVVDVVKTVHRALRDGDPTAYRIPDSTRAVGQVLSTFRSSHRPDDLSHLITPDAHSAVIWLQHESGDNLDVSAVIAHVEAYLAAHPLPEGVRVRWAGLPYINVVWQREMVEGMAAALMGSFVIVLLMMVALFRSLRYGLLSMLPLAFTIAVIYGAIGLFGKDYDMPVAVLSSLALGLSVDFAIHFIERARALLADNGDVNTVMAHMFEEPARAILRNLAVVAVGFLPLLLAPLVPYVTVGVLMAAIMILSGLATLLLLPALLRIFWRVRVPSHPPAAPFPTPQQESLS